MNAYILLLLISSTLAINTTSTLSNSGPWCATSPSGGRGSPRPADCLTLATFILATTTHRSQYVQFSLHPYEGQIKLPYTRSSGTCELFIIITTTDPTPTVPVTSSFDAVLRNMLDVVGSCLLNNQPETSNFGGVAKIGVSDRLILAIHATRANGGVQGNETLGLGDMSGWLQDISLS
jgi:hypothetical protein